MKDRSFDRRSCWPDHADCTHREYIGLECTLAGHPATLCKNDEGFAVVATYSGPARNLEYSWTAVYNTFENRNGDFLD